MRGGAEEGFLELLESLPDAVIIATREGKIVLLNGHAERLFGYPRAELVGGSVEVLVPSRFRRRHREHLRKFAAVCGRRCIGSGGGLYALRKDGSEVPVEIALSALQHGRAEPLVASSIRDISARRQAERDLARQARALKRVNAELEAANRDLEGILYSVSHDLKAPLRAIEGFADALAEDHGERLDDSGHECLEGIRNGAVRMGEMIDDLLALARLGEQFLAVGPVDMGVVVERVMEDLAPEIRARGARVDIAGSLPVVTGHFVTLQRLMQNLLSNALKFVPRGRPPEVTISATASASETDIGVRDNGIGIEPRHRDAIFDIFKRLHPEEAFPGTGVGLAIVRKAAALHRGRVWVDSEPGAGSVFHLALPLSPPREEGSRRVARAPAAGS